MARVGKPNPTGFLGYFDFFPRFVMYKSLLNQFKQEFNIGLLEMKDQRVLNQQDVSR